MTSGTPFCAETWSPRLAAATAGVRVKSSSPWAKSLSQTSFELLLGSKSTLPRPLPSPPGINGENEGLYGGLVSPFVPHLLRHQACRLRPMQQHSRFDLSLQRPLRRFHSLSPIISLSFLACVWRVGQDGVQCYRVSPEDTRGADQPPPRTTSPRYQRRAPRNAP